MLKDKNFSRASNYAERRKLVKKLEYKVLTGQALSEELAIKELERKVNEHLQKGWKTQGGVSINKIGSAAHYVFTIVQAMTKE